MLYIFVGSRWLWCYESPQLRKWPIRRGIPQMSRASIRLFSHQGLSGLSRCANVQSRERKKHTTYLSATIRRVRQSLLHINVTELLFIWNGSTRVTNLFKSSHRGVATPEGWASSLPGVERGLQDSAQIFTMAQVVTWKQKSTLELHYQKGLWKWIFKFFFVIEDHLASFPQSTESFWVH